MNASIESMQLNISIRNLLCCLKANELSNGNAENIYKHILVGEVAVGMYQTNRLTDEVRVRASSQLAR